MIPESRPRRALGQTIRIIRVSPWWIAGWVAPLPRAVYENRRSLAGDAPQQPELLPVGWMLEQQQGLLERSEERLRGIEAKAPGLATLTAIVAAAIAVAIAEAWADTGTLGRWLLVASAVYAALSLVTSIWLVGPQGRARVTGEVLEMAAAKGLDSERVLGGRMTVAAANNDRLTLRLSKLQVASRNTLVSALVLLGVWGLLTIVGVDDVDGVEPPTPIAGNACPDRGRADVRESTVFLVHGHDRQHRREVKAFLKNRERLRVVVLAEKPNRGETIIEKLERYACRASRAVVLYTGDDRGALAKAHRLRPRARQNVVFELGLFYGLLSRRRVVVLAESGIELPSDIEGVVLIRLDEKRAWHHELARELARIP